MDDTYFYLKCLCLNFVLLTKQKILTYSMQHSPSCKTNRSVASQQITHILWKTKVNCRIRRWPPHVSNLSQLDPIHTPTPHYLKVHLSIILTSITRPPKWPLTLRFPHQNLVHGFPLCYTCYMPLLSHFSLFYHPNNVGCEVQIINLLIM